MPHVSQIFQAEDLVDADKLRMGFTTQATASSTLSLTRSSTFHQAFTGTTAGQIVKFPDATTLTNGWTYFIWNEATQTISLRNNGNTELQILPATFNSIIVLRDNSTANGSWSISRSSPGSGGTGVTPPFLFSRSGAVVTSSYLNVGSVTSSNTGQIIPGSNYIVKVTVSCSSTISTNTTIQFQRRTAVSTFSDITGAYAIIPAGSYSVSYILPTPIAIGPDWELACYNKSGSNIDNPIALLFVIPA